MKGQTSSDTWTEGQSMSASLTRTSPSTLTITWTIPGGKANIYNGALVLLSTTAMNPSNYPLDGQAYNPSSNWAAPNDTIGSAHVVGAFYNDKTTVSVDVVGLDANTVYFGSVHLITNVNTYYNPGIKTYPEDVVTDAYSAAIDQEYGPPTNPTLGQIYFDINTQFLYRWDGATWVQVLQKTIPVGGTNPVAGDFVGDLFYNEFTKTLLTWNGTIWTSAETLPRGPMYNRKGVGTDGSSDERLDLIDTLKRQMGYPVVCVELDDAQWNIAVNNAIQEARRRLDNAYYPAYVSMTVKSEQQRYYLNDPSVGTDKIVDVLKIHRMNLMALGQLQDGGIYAQQFLSQFFQPGGQVDILSVHLINTLAEDFTTIFAGNFTFTWRETTREMLLLRRVFRDEVVLLECAMEKTEQELLSDRWTVQWIQQWAEAEAMLMLARIRGKYASLPGPGGALSLNAGDLQTAADALQLDCLRQIQDMEVGNGTNNFVNYAFLIG
jgi:hypothetical protein